MMEPDEEAHVDPESLLFMLEHDQLVGPYGSWCACDTIFRFIAELSVTSPTIS